MSTADLTTELARLVSGEHRDPHSVLGPHIGPDGVTVRVLRPMADAVTSRVSAITSAIFQISRFSSQELSGLNSIPSTVASISAARSSA